MTVTNSEVKVNITAESKQAKKAIDDIARSLGALKSQAGDTSKQTGILNSGAMGLFGTFTAAGLATQAITAGLRILKNELVSSIKSAQESENVLAQTNAVLLSTGGAAGITAEAVSNLAKQFQSQTTYSDEAVQSAQNLLLTFTDIKDNIFPDATSIVLDMSTALGQDLKGSAIQLGKALQDPILGVTALRRVGVNFNSTQQEVIKNLVLTGQKAKAQEMIMAELRKEFGGSSTAAAKTFAGQVLQLTNRIDDLKEEIGRAIIPVLSYLVQAFANTEEAGGVVTGVFKVIATAAVILAGSIKNAGLELGLLFNTAKGLITGGVKGMKEYWNAGTYLIKDNSDKMADSIEKIWTTSTKEMAGKTAINFQEMATEVNQTAKQLAKDLEKENKSYANSLKSMNNNFKKSLNDLIFAHRDKKKSLEKDMKDENKAFDTSMSDRKDTFDEDMLGLEDSHSKKTKSIEEDIAAEEAALIISQNKLKAFQDDKYLTEINQSKAKLDSLKRNLTDENREYEMSKEKIKSVYEKETEKIKQEHQARLAMLQAELQIEMDIYSKYESDFNALKDKVAEDDITRLKRKYEEEKKELEAQHSEKLADLYQQGAEESASKEAGQQRQSSSNTAQTIQNASNTAKANAPAVVKPIITSSPVSGSSAQPTGNSGWNISGVVSSIGNAIGNAWNWLTSKLPHFAEGGVVQGEVGKPVTAVVHGGEKIIPVGGGSGGNVNLTVNIGVYAGSVVEKRNLAMSLWNEVGKLAKSQGRTPEELLNFAGV